MKTSEILERAHALIAEPSARLRNGLFAVDVNGYSRYGWEPDACRFCAAGAVQRAVGSADEYYTLRVTGNDAVDLLHRAAEKVAGPSFGDITVLNDKGSDDQLDACFHTAIAMAKELEAV